METGSKKTRVTLQEVVNHMATNLLALRLIYKRSLREVALGTGLASNSIMRYERGSRVPSIRALVKISNYFCVDISDITQVPDKEFKRIMKEYQGQLPKGPGRPRKPILLSVKDRKRLLKGRKVNLHQVSPVL